MSYNLLDEHWIPVAGHEPVSLQAIFSDESLRHLGGNPVEKISVMNLLRFPRQRALRIMRRSGDNWEPT